MGAKYSSFHLTSYNTTVKLVSAMFHKEIFQKILDFNTCVTHIDEKVSTVIDVEIQFC